MINTKTNLFAYTIGMGFVPFGMISLLHWVWGAMEWEPLTTFEWVCVTSWHWVFCTWVWLRQLQAQGDLNV